MPTVLIVDDRKTNREFLRTLLEYVPYTVFEAFDGEDGLAKTILHKPDLIITDILMPHVDGFEFLRNLRAHPDFAGTPVIVFTSTYLEDEAKGLAERCGVFRVLLRPTEPHEILKAVELALQSDSAALHPVPDATYAVEHRRLLTDKLAAKVADLEAEVALRKEGEARLAAALSASGQRVLDLDLLTNETTMTGPDPEGNHTVELRGSFDKFLKAVHSDDVGLITRAIKTAEANHTDVLVTYRLHTLESGERVIEAKGRFERDANGRAIRLIGSLSDITKRDAEERVRLLQAAVVEHSLEFIGAATPDGIVTFINRSGLQMIGVEDPNEVIGKPMATHIHPSSLGVVENESLPALRQRASWRGEIQFLNIITNEAVPCECTCIAIQDSDSNITQLSIVGRDIRSGKEVQRQLNARLAQLTALRKIDVAISGAVNLQLILQVVMNEVMAIEAIQAACVFIYIPELRYLEYAAGSGLEESRQLQKLAESAVSERKTTRDEFEGGSTLEAIPLVAKGIVMGVLAIVQKPKYRSDPANYQFVDAIAGQAAIAIDNALLFEDLQRSKNDLAQAYDETLEGWSRALDLRDRETEGHSRRVTDLTMKIAREMRVPPESLPHIRRGALLHDIGKVGVPDAILLKPGPLDEEETAIMRKHAEYAVDLIGPIAYLQPALDIPFCHHERWDGAGYPRGLKGLQIPMAARIFAVADVWDALRSDRPYRKAWPFDKVVEHIKSGAGSHFDPTVVSAFLRVIRSGSELL